MFRFLSTHIRATGLLICIAGCFLAAQGTGIRLFFHLFYILAALLIVSFVWAHSNVHGLEIKREPLTPRAYVGEYARERISLRNRWILPKLWVEVYDYSDLPQHGVGFVASLAGRKRQRWTARTLCVRRGRFTLGPAALISGDPFGIFRVERHLPHSSEILVYPRVVDLATVPFAGAILPGGREVRHRTYHVTPNVSTVRDYASGDSFNRIHWRTTARTGRLMVKEFEMDPTSDVYIVLDMHERTVVTDPRFPVRFSGSNDLLESTEEYAVMTAASVGRHLLKQNRVVGLIAWGQQHQVLPAEREARQLFKLLEALAILRASGTQPLAEVLLAEGVRFGRNSTLIIITASLDLRWPAALQQILYRHVRAVVLFVDPQSFGGRQDPEPLLAHLAELQVPTYRLRQGQSLADGLGQ